MPERESPKKNYNKNYHVDVAICVDASHSMADFWDWWRTRDASFYHEILKRMGEEIKRRSDWETSERFRMRVLAFRDYGVDQIPLRKSDFFTIAEGEGDESEELASFVRSVTIGGGGDLPENGLEALYKAIVSDWDDSVGTQRKRVIVVVTDAPALPLGKEFMTYGVGDGRRGKANSRVTSSNYPKNMPKTLEELGKAWDGMSDEKEKRLFVFAPALYPWDRIADGGKPWKNAVRFEFCNEIEQVKGAPLFAVKNDEKNFPQAINDLIRRTITEDLR